MKLPAGLLKKAKPWFWIAIIYGTVFVLPIIMYFTSLDEIEQAQSFCPVKMLTGIPCPGCGMTKSILCLFHGEWQKSISFHAFGPVLVAILLLYPFFRRISFGPFVRFYSNRLLYILIAAFMLYYLYRLGMYITTHSFPEVLKESIWL